MPLGYDAVNRKLRVNAEDAKTVGCCLSSTSSSAVSDSCRRSVSD